MIEPGNRGGPPGRRRGRGTLRTAWEGSGAGAPVHPCLPPHPASGAVPLAEARLTDRQRLGVVLQAAALLAHLEEIGWHLPEGWAEARIAGAGALLLPEPRPGRSSVPAQELLRSLLSLLFSDPGAAPSGRGEARRAARLLA